MQVRYQLRHSPNMSRQYPYRLAPVNGVSGDSCRILRNSSPSPRFQRSQGQKPHSCPNSGTTEVPTLQ